MTALMEMPPTGTRPAATPRPDETEPPSYTTSEGLRRLVVHLHVNNAWREDPDVEALVRHCITKYGALARRYRQTPQDAAAAAFEALRARGLIEAVDPWAVVTRAVQLALQAEDRADGLLCSPASARKLMHTPDHDVVRFGERDDQAWVDLACDAALDDTADAEATKLRAEDVDPGEVPARVERLAELLVALGWPQPVALLAVEYVCRRVILAGSVGRAFEYLRRDPMPLGLLDLDKSAWTRVCTVLLGSPDRDRRFTAIGRGVLPRILLGEQPEEILTDFHIVRALWEARPGSEVRCA
jgi:hypothetical protein